MARALTVQADVGDGAQVQAMFAVAVREFGTIDILVSNAGMERNASFHDMTTAQWDAVMNVNLRGRGLFVDIPAWGFVLKLRGRKRPIHECAL